MPRSYQLKTNFVAGELDPLLLSRQDIKHYYNAGARVRNAVVIPQGGVLMRPGSEYLFTVPDLPGGGPSNVRMASFQFNTEQTYLIVFHHLTITIFRNDAVVATVVSPYTSDDLVASETAGGDLISSGIYWSQSKDTMLIFHEGHPIQQLKREGSHSSWSISEYVLTNVPRFDFGEVYTDPEEVGVDEVHKMIFINPGSQGDWTINDTFTLTLEDEETDNINYSATASTLATRIQDALRRLKNTSTDGITVTQSGGSTPVATFTITYSGEDGQREWGSLFGRVVSAKQVPSLDTWVETPGQYPGEVVFSATRGYPRCGVFFGGRLWVAGTPSLPHWVWSSRVGAEADFNSELFRDDYGIKAPADTNDVPAFTAIYPGRHLQFFSRSGEYYVPASEREPITPENMALRRTTSRGNKAGLRVYEVDGATHFVQRRGQALREFIFTDIEQAYQANNISLLSPHLVRDPVDFAIRRSTSTTDADYEFLPNADGTMMVFCTLRTQEVNAMTLWKTKGSYKACAVVLDEVYFAVSREVDGSTKIFIEKMDDEMTVDCGIKGVTASGATLAHLPNSMIENVLDGAIQQGLTSDGSGNITFSRQSDSWFAGLKFAAPDDEYPDMIWLVKTLPVELQLPEGTATGRKVRVSSLTVRMNNTAALSVNGKNISFTQFGSGVLDQGVQPFTGTKKLRGMLGWTKEGSIVLGSSVSLRGEILGLSYGVTV